MWFFKFVRQYKMIIFSLVNFEHDFLVYLKNIYILQFHFFIIINDSYTRNSIRPYGDKTVFFF
jgi:hypothetical protein